MKAAYSREWFWRKLQVKHNLDFSYDGHTTHIDVVRSIFIPSYFTKKVLYELADAIKVVIDTTKDPAKVIRVVVKDSLARAFVEDKFGVSVKEFKKMVADPNVDLGDNHQKAIDLIMDAEDNGS